MQIIIESIIIDIGLFFVFHINILDYIIFIQGIIIVYFYFFSGRLK